MIDDEFMQSHLRNASMMLILIPLDELESYVKRIRDNNNRWDSFGHIFDPTAYRDAMYNGKREQTKIELDIAEHLLEVRRLIESLNID